MWPFKRVSTLLPLAKGPYVPGIKDVIIKYSRDGILARFYYPTDLKNSALDYKSKWIKWVPSDDYFKGFSAVIMLPWTLIKFGFWLKSLLFGAIKIPAVYGAKIKKKDQFKCIIFSHGLGATRFFSSTICINLASYGFLVIALEHRDGSASNTYYFDNANDLVNNEKMYIPYENVIFKENHLAVRHEQVIKRSHECSKMINYLKEINQGICPENLLDLVEFDEFSLDDLVGKIDINDFTIGGHSFGAATSLLTLSNLREVKRGILLDPWMFPIKNMNEQICKIQKPLLFINSETFHVISNVNAMEKYLNKKDVEMYTVLGTTHEFQTDTLYITGYLLNLFMKKLNPVTAINLNDALILKFLNKFALGFNEQIPLLGHGLLLERYRHYIRSGLAVAWK